MDEGIALAAFENFLIIFAKNSIVVYENPDVPANLALKKIFVGVGCIVRDSVQNTGEDLIWLSNKGIMSFRQLLIQDSLPFMDSSKNVRDDLLSDIALETAGLPLVRSAYSQKHGFYLLLLPTLKKLWVMDTKLLLEDGARRFSTWTGMQPDALFVSQDQELWISKSNKLNKYSGNTDLGTNYTVNYLSNWLELTGTEDPATNNRLFLVKNLAWTIQTGVNSTITFKHGFDYSPKLNINTRSFNGVAVAEYGIAKWSIGEWTTGINLENTKVPTTGFGVSIRYGLTSSISAGGFTLYSFG